MANYRPNGKKSNDYFGLSDVGEWFTNNVVHNPVTDYWDDNWRSLQNAWNGDVQDENDYDFANAINSVPGLGSYWRGKLTKPQLFKYMNFYGLGWSDLNPVQTLNHFGGGNNAYNGTRIVSDMVKFLYS